MAILEGEEIYCVDTSVVVEGKVAELVTAGKISGTIIVHKAVLSELEHQANFGKPTGLAGLEELKKLRALADKGKLNLEFLGSRPGDYEIKYAKAGEIDAIIRDMAVQHKATLVTADKVQAEAARAMGVKVLFIEFVKKTARPTLRIEGFFDNTTMSVHIKENLRPYAKKGQPGDWKLVPVGEEKLTREEVQAMAEEIVEAAKSSREGLIESNRKTSTIIQLERYRIVIVHPPFSDGWEITIVRPIVVLALKDYNLDEKLLERLKEKAEGIVLAGPPGHGKSTLAQALAEFYKDMGKIVKTVESPRDLQVSDEITQYAKSLGSTGEIHDILLLSRPDYTIYDEMRTDPDFKMYADLRLAGIGLVGVVHATTAIDAIQRFLGRVEMGAIPHVVDTVFFIKNGKPEKVYELEMTVKVPSGMVEADLTRPVIEVRDVLSGKLEYEIYSFGEATTIVPVRPKGKATRAFEMAAERVKSEIEDFTEGAHVKVEMTTGESATVWVDSSVIPQLIGRQGKNIEKIEKTLGLHLDVRSLEEKGHDEDEFQQTTSEADKVGFNISETSGTVKLFFDKSLTGRSVDFYLGENLLFSAAISRKGVIRLDKKSEMAKKILARHGKITARLV